MFRRSGLQTHYLSTALIALTVTAFVATPLALAKVVFNTIDPVAIVSDNGRHLIVTGPIECTRGERVYVRVTVTQRVSGAIAEGLTLLVCDGEGRRQQWRIDAASQGRERFQPGAALAVASARTAFRGESTDAHQWLVDINLVDD
jgi:hypothetical protein